jgi:hypothetical protein
MKAIVNNIAVDLSEKELFRISRHETVTIPEMEGCFCHCCGFPVKYEHELHMGNMGYCKKCKHENAIIHLPKACQFIGFKL